MSETQVTKKSVRGYKHHLADMQARMPTRRSQEPPRRSSSLGSLTGQRPPTATHRRTASLGGGGSDRKGIRGYKYHMLEMQAQAKASSPSLMRSGSLGSQTRRSQEPPRRSSSLGSLTRKSSPTTSHRRSTSVGGGASDKGIRGYKYHMLEMQGLTDSSSSSRSSSSEMQRTGKRFSSAMSKTSRKPGSDPRIVYGYKHYLNLIKNQGKGSQKSLGKSRWKSMNRGTPIGGRSPTYAVSKGSAQSRAMGRTTPTKGFPIKSNTRGGLHGYKHHLAHIARRRSSNRPPPRKASVSSGRKRSVAGS